MELWKLSHRWGITEVCWNYRREILSGFKPDPDTVCKHKRIPGKIEGPKDPGRDGRIRKEQEKEKVSVLFGGISVAKLRVKKFIGHIVIKNNYISKR